MNWNQNQRAIASQLKDANGDHDLENSLKKRERELKTEIQKIKMFIMTRGFHQ